MTAKAKITITTITIGSLDNEKLGTTQLTSGESLYLQLKEAREELEKVRQSLPEGAFSYTVTGELLNDH